VATPSRPSAPSFPRDATASPRRTTCWTTRLRPAPRTTVRRHCWAQFAAQLVVVSATCPRLPLLQCASIRSVARARRYSPNAGNTAGGSRSSPRVHRRSEKASSRSYPVPVLGSIGRTRTPASAPATIGRIAAAAGFASPAARHLVVMRTQSPKGLGSLLDALLAPDRRAVRLRASGAIKRSAHSAPALRGRSFDS
jgi:hypothetical protein